MASWNSKPAIVFGQRGKLRSDGPFLGMLRGFDDFLSKSRRLVIVGYSFRDEHINSAIRRWWNASAARQVTIIDPALTDIDRHNSSRVKFLEELLEAMSVNRREPPWGRFLKPPHNVLAEAASVGLKQCFGDGPKLRPADPLSS